LLHFFSYLVAVKIGVVGRAHTLVEAEGAVGADLDVVSHDRELVEGGLSIEEHDVLVLEVTFDNVTDGQLFGEVCTVGDKLEVDFLVVRVLNVICSGVDIGTVKHVLAQTLDVVRKNALGVRQHLGDELGNGDLVDLEVGVGRDDRTRRKVDTLAREIATEATLLALEALAEATNRFPLHLSISVRKTGDAKKQNKTKQKNTC